MTTYEIWDSGEEVGRIQTSPREIDAAVKERYPQLLARSPTETAEATPDNSSEKWVTADIETVVMRLNSQDGVQLRAARE